MINQYKTIIIKTEADLKASSCLFCNVSFYHDNIANYLNDPKNNSYFIIGCDQCHHVNYWFDNYTLQHIEIIFQNHEFTYYPSKEIMYDEINKSKYETYHDVTIEDFKSCFSSEETIKNFLLF